MLKMAVDQLFFATAMLEITNITAREIVPTDLFVANHSHPARSRSLRRSPRNRRRLA